MKRIVIAALLTIISSSSALAAKVVAESNVPTSTAATSTKAAHAVAAATPAPAPAASTNSAPAASNNSWVYIGAQFSDASAGGLVGYQFNKLLSMEISYDVVNPVNTSNTLHERSRYGASGVALFPIKFIEIGATSIYMKLGFGHSTDKLTVTTLPASTTITSTDKAGITGGAGVHVDLNRNISSRLGVNVIDTDKTIYLAAMYKF